MVELAVPREPKRFVTWLANTTQGWLGTAETVLETNSAELEFEASSISGFVWNDLNASGTWQANEPLLPGVKLSLRDGNGELLDTETTTGADGSYVFNASPRARLQGVGRSIDAGLRCRGLRGADRDGPGDDFADQRPDYAAINTSADQVDIGYRQEVVDLQLEKSGTLDGEPVAGSSIDWTFYHHRQRSTTATALDTAIASAEETVAVAERVLGKVTPAEPADYGYAIAGVAAAEAALADLKRVRIAGDARERRMPQTARRGRSTRCAELEADAHCGWTGSAYRGEFRVRTRRSKTSAALVQVWLRNGRAVRSSGEAGAFVRSFAELKKVVTPTRKELDQLHALLRVGFVIVMMALVWVLTRRSLAATVSSWIDGRLVSARLIPATQTEKQKTRSMTSEKQQTTTEATSTRRSTRWRTRSGSERRRGRRRALEDRHADESTAAAPRSSDEEVEDGAEAEGEDPYKAFKKELASVARLRLQSPAGADEVGGDELIEKVAAGYTDFDSAVSTPELMGKVGRLGKVLGPWSDAEPEDQRTVNS
ncbi:hypothetical protein FQA39_LY18646 [Lamprigera yunnana]|nr:hypothetical protein FQA39_LY18646 [Lamprigera yunnana]